LRGVKVFDLDTIMAAYDEATALAAVERAIVAFSAGQAQTGASAHLVFVSAPGDCHVRSGNLHGDDVFVVKVSSSFYDNPKRGLSSSQGFVAVISAATGEPLAILQDRGHLTNLRTAMAGLLAARAIGYDGKGVIGIIGTGIQAQMQAELIRRHLGADRLLVWGRDADKAQSLADELGGTTSALEPLVRQARLIVTTTPSTVPLIDDAWVWPGTRIVAVGADGGGKRELDPAILHRATVVVDSVEQSLASGESGWAVKAGLLSPDALIELGALLAAPRTFGDDETVVADLTGLGVQDAAIAGAVWRALADT
jgi:ornithine cyclodeaminase